MSEYEIKFKSDVACIGLAIALRNSSAVQRVENKYSQSYYKDLWRDFERDSRLRRYKK